MPEYWLIDPDRQEAEFYRLADNGHYSLAMAGSKGIYRSRATHGFWLQIAWLRADPPLAGIEALAQMGVLPPGEQ